MTMSDRDVELGPMDQPRHPFAGCLSGCLVMIGSWVAVILLILAVVMYGRS